MGVFGTRAFEELAPRRGAPVEVGDFNDCAAIQRRGFGLAILIRQAPGVIAVRHATGQADPRHRGDRGQRFAAKAVTGDTFQIIQRADFARSVARQSQSQVIMNDAFAIIGNPNQTHAAFFQLHVDLPGARIEAVFHHLLEDRGGPLYHFASGDLADQEVWQGMDDAHCSATKRVEKGGGL